MRIETLLLDLGDTVFGLGPLPADIPQRVAASLAGAGVDRADMLAEAIVAAAMGFYAASDPLELPEADLSSLAGSVAGHHGLALAPGAREAVQDAFAAADIGRFRGTTACGETLRGLRGIVSKVGIVSNTTTPPELLNRYLASIGVLDAVDVIVYSVAFGRRKPHPDIYREALRRLAADPQTTLFVGDRVREDIRGPMAAGMRAALSHEFRQEDPTASAPAAVLQSLADLPGLIGRLE